MSVVKLVQRRLEKRDAQFWRAIPIKKRVAVVLWRVENGYPHGVKSVRIRSYSGPYFSAFKLNTERYLGGRSW